MLTLILWYRIRYRKICSRHVQGNIIFTALYIKKNTLLGYLIGYQGTSLPDLLAFSDFSWYHIRCHVTINEVFATIWFHIGYQRYHQCNIFILNVFILLSFSSILYSFFANKCLAGLMGPEVPLCTQSFIHELLSVGEESCWFPIRNHLSNVTINVIFIGKTTVFLTDISSILMRFSDQYISNQIILSYIG